MGTQVNGHTNGTSGIHATQTGTRIARFSDVPTALDIQVSGGDAEEAVEISLEELLDDPTELCTLLENENAEKRTWMVIALAYARQEKVDLAIGILQKGLVSLSRGNAKEKLGPLSLLCWMYLGKTRHAPRVLPEDQAASDVRTKEHWLQAATGILNEAARINPAYSPLYLARGVLHLLRASLQPMAKPVAAGSADHSERTETIRLAQKSFEDASKVASGRNMMAAMGSARALFSLGKYAEALTQYQTVLARMPSLCDPDPRTGIGCCLWRLGYKAEARDAWERALEVRPEAPVAMILIGLSYLNDSSDYPISDPAFSTLYKKAMTEYTQKAYKANKDLPLTNVTFAGYFMMRKAWSTVEALSKKAIESTDVNAIASDGWYLLARKEHHQETIDFNKVSDFYARADTARGGGDKGFVPARFGIAQALVLQGDVDSAKFRLEKIVQSSRSTEAMMLLGALLAEEVFQHQSMGSKEDYSSITKKAIAMFEAVRICWKDSSKKLTPDLSVLVYLARLYEADQPEKAFQCLQQVERMNLEELLERQGLSIQDEDEDKLNEMREALPPQLLNNLGCFQYQAERYDRARDLFQSALNSSVRYGEKDASIDIDALATTISYNLARTIEATGDRSEARKVYENLLTRHSNYTDARIRRAYIDMLDNPTTDGQGAVASLHETDGANLEVRALLGWYLSKTKKRASNIAEDQEQKHYKKTLVDFDKHDRYSLTGMGNLYSAYAREMRRSTDKEKEKRSAEYLRAVGYFDKVLQLDPRNAYAAQGISIALAEDRKDLTSTIQILTKVKETIKDSSVLVNLGHVYAELKQYTRSIENYEAALRRDRAADSTVLACLGRVWLFKGKQDKSVEAMKRSLDYSRRALSLSPSQIHFRFNTAFVQIQLAQLMYTLPESQRTLSEVQAAAAGLEQAIEALYDIAKSDSPPYPKHDIEQRANMGRNTMTKQLDRAIQAQKDYEEKNAARLETARKRRESDSRRREEGRAQAEAAIAEERRRVQEERQKMLESSRALAERRAEDEQKKEAAEMTTDSETGQKVRRRKKTKATGGSGGGGRRKKKVDMSSESGSESEGKFNGKRRKKAERQSAVGSDSSDGEKTKGPTKKRRRLTRNQEKFKSSERVADSSDEEEEEEKLGGEERDEDENMSDAPSEGAPIPGPTSMSVSASASATDEAKDATATTRRTVRKTQRIESDESAEE